MSKEKYQNNITYELKMKNICYFLYGTLARVHVDDTVINSRIYPVLVNGNSQTQTFNSQDNSFIKQHFAEGMLDIANGEEQLLYDLYGRRDNRYHSSGSICSQLFTERLNAENVIKMTRKNRDILDNWDCSRFKTGMLEFLGHIEESESKIGGKYAFQKSNLHFLTDRLITALECDAENELNVYAYVLTWLLIASIARGNLKIPQMEELMGLSGMFEDESSASGKEMDACPAENGTLLKSRKEVEEQFLLEERLSREIRRISLVTYGSTLLFSTPKYRQLFVSLLEGGTEIRVILVDKDSEAFHYGMEHFYYDSDLEMRKKLCADSHQSIETLAAKYANFYMRKTTLYLPYTMMIIEADELHSNIKVDFCSFTAALDGTGSDSERRSILIWKKDDLENYNFYQKQFDTLWRLHANDTMEDNEAEASVKPLAGADYCDRPVLQEMISSNFARNRHLILAGDPGSGKSDVARKYVREQIGAAKRNIFWINIQEEEESVYEECVSQICKKLEVPEKNINDSMKENDFVVIECHKILAVSEIMNILIKLWKPKILLLVPEYRDDRDEMEKLGGVIHTQEPELIQKEAAFYVNVFCRYAKIKSPDWNEKISIQKIAEKLCHNLFLIRIVAIHCCNNGWSAQECLHILDMKLHESGCNACSILEQLARENFLCVKFSETERQVLGTVIVMSGITQDKNVLCRITGDYEWPGPMDNPLEKKCTRAADAMDSLLEKGILQEYGNCVYLHPVIEKFLTDQTFFRNGEENTGRTLAELSFSYICHIFKNRLIENEDTDTGNKTEDYLVSDLDEWIARCATNFIIPNLRKQNQDLNLHLLGENYLLAYCKGADGSAVYAKFESGAEICLLNAGCQRKREFRYFINGFTAFNADFYDCAIIGYGNGEIEKVEIPGQVTGCKVSMIGKEAFYNCGSLKEVNFPDGLRRIGESAFSGCNRLESIDFPDTLYEIGKDAFLGCSNLRNITGLNRAPHLRFIRDNAFKGCSAVEGRLVFSESMVSIGDSAFEECEALEEVLIPYSVYHVGSYLFRNCKKLQKVYLGNHLVKVAKGMFQGCRSLSFIHIPMNIKQIEDEAFQDCVRLGKADLERGVKSIGEKTFENCYNLTAVNIPSSVNKMGTDVFKKCNHLEIMVENGPLAKLFDENAEAVLFMLGDGMSYDIEHSQENEILIETKIK